MGWLFPTATDLEILNIIYEHNIQTWLAALAISLGRQRVGGWPCFTMVRISLHKRGAQLEGLHRDFSGDLFVKLWGQMCVPYGGLG